MNGNSAGKHGLSKSVDYPPAKIRRKNNPLPPLDDPGPPAHGDQPDPDAIKMFIGQIPKTWVESEVREFLEGYGPIYQLNILREKGSVMSKGCCFVTFYTRKAALAAQNELHNMKTLPGMHHCVQMKPADSENKSEDRKLFIGMISKKMTEQDLRQLFCPFGNIEECRILMNPDGVSKGCAFVTYSKRVSAQNAIRNMHQSTTMEGCSAPIVVKIADSPKDKERKKTQSQLAMQLNQFSNQWKNLSGLAALAPVLQSLACNNQYNAPSNQHNSGVFSTTQLQQALTIAAAAQTLLSNQPSSVSHNNSNSVPGSSGISSMTSQYGGNVCASPSGTSYRSHSHNSNMWAQQHSAPYPSAGMNNGMSSGCSSTSPLDPMTMNLAQQSGSNLTLDLNHSPSSTATAMYNQSMMHPHNSSPAGSHKEGPEGSNLFIYHLPTHFTDHDLMQTFFTFGTIVSAKVFIDKQTNLSKCFGFVSYDNPASAQHAIQAMHGFQIGMKRLKVQLKRPKGESKAY
uniref:CUGBP Elav-like family member 2 isoform X2 n=1 Tax=Ciona intestinalis TaxID=7719 RepID=UPI000EF4A726|nr:CUGBP Elav-like family member 2 isoform X2 [Ciona intestinalis]|eukprot:XP_026696283.1 CUGBP Elav-like family member 2 isoform X2 [Ciona intestinalis]